MSKDSGGAGTRVQKSRGSGRQALLVVVKVGEEDTWERVEEMRGLCASAGLSVVGEVVQRRKSPASGTYVGKGKLEEIQLEVERTGAKLVVLDRETTPVQLKHLEDALPVEVMDRTGLILDVFARHAHSGEGKLQVELASLRYRLPRLVGKGVELSRLGGRTGARTAMGTRGAGEPWLVEQRRRLRREMKGLEEKIEQLGKRRELARKWRRRNQVPTVGIVGYTNAGKSTLLNSLSASKVVVEDRLFSTLDPTSRAVILPGGRRAIFSDTVGFIRDLPPGLTAAFRATIEEATSADILLHVVDLSSPHWETQRGAVFLILNQLGCAGKPVVTAFNKIDLVSPSPSLKAVCEPEGKGAFVSAKAGKGLEELLRLVEEEIGRFSRENWVRVPYEQLGDAGATGKASRVRYEKDGIQVLVNNPTRVNH